MKISRAEIKEVYDLPITTLIYRAQEVHQKNQVANGIFLTAAKSVKTGGCPEDCAYCPQSAHYRTFVEKEGMIGREDILTYARESKASGASRMCMGAAWGKVPKAGGFVEILDVIPEIKEMGLQVCCSIGTMDNEQIKELQEAGCNVVNYNLDTSKEFYDKIINTRSYDDRYGNLRRIQEQGMEVCCGGILGLGEEREDRIGLLESLINLDPQPESVPVNALMPIQGTPLGERKTIDSIEYVRFIATTRIFMPKTFISIAAGRVQMSEEMQALCFVAGANSFIIGGKILTTENPSVAEDMKMMEKLGLEKL